MNFAILAAGLGSRLKREGILLPKGLVNLNGAPMIERLIRLCDKFDYNTLSVIVNKESPELADFIKSKANKDKLRLVVKTTPSSMHSLYELKKHLLGDYFCLFTVDSIFINSEFKNYISYAATHKEYDATLAVTEYIDDEKPLYIKTNSENEITDFPEEKGDTEFVSGGIYYFSPKVFDILDECIALGMDKLRNFQRMIIKKNLKVKAYKFSKIIDVDHANDIKNAVELLRKNQ